MAAERLGVSQKDIHCHGSSEVNRSNAHYVYDSQIFAMREEMAINSSQWRQGSPKPRAWGEQLSNAELRGMLASQLDGRQDMADFLVVEGYLQDEFARWADYGDRLMRTISPQRWTALAVQILAERAQKGVAVPSIVYSIRDLRHKFSPLVLQGSLVAFSCSYFGEQPLDFAAYFATVSGQFRSAVVPDHLACAGLWSLIRGIWRYPIQADRACPRDDMARLGRVLASLAQLVGWHLCPSSAGLR
mmetsp:Transcript_60346/g.160641  ORF Transcript_60346/g.160641 Transcript_60346/m.160641 type:complete len:245 (-) Transcript_60346:41-775(-)